MARVTRSAQPGKAAFARAQRQSATADETVLWQALRGGRLGAKFRRQHPLGEFVLDFYCESGRLAVELDGEPHERQAGYDRWRDEELERRGIRTLRIASETVHRDLEGVVRQIAEALTALTAASPPPEPAVRVSPSPSPEPPSPAEPAVPVSGEGEDGDGAAQDRHNGESPTMTEPNVPFVGRQRRPHITA
jgi:very-short-patch-repair endonuclease